ncbi:MAG: integrase [Pseudooceanicola sp.]|nr:integrase [Pseudooceanicola sp.]
MPRPAKPARLVKWKHSPYWQIRHGNTSSSTGCTSRLEAEAVLAEFIRQRDRAHTSHEPGQITVAEVLTIYAEEHAPTTADPGRIGYAIDALLPFWGEMKLSAVKGETCRRYAKHRAKAPGTIRRELGALQSAINYCHREGYITAAPLVTLPEKPEARTRWLTREEAAKLLWTAYRRSPHIARFILIGIYTGTRRDAILRMGFAPNTVGGWFDLDRGIMYRRGDGERETKKRRTPAPIPRQLLAHLRRWKAQGGLWAVEFSGARVGSIKTAFPSAVAAAGLGDVTPHTLKHTAITWALQGGASVWDCAGFFATSPETIERVYGHHSPNHQASVLRAIEGRK